MPVFLVTHSKKDNTRLVFDSSAEYYGTSLINLLLEGSDRNNSFKAVMFRFRNVPITVAADIETMFHMFYIPVYLSDFARFVWFENNLVKKLVQMWAKVHIFGNKRSPAVADHGLRTAALFCSLDISEKSRNFVPNDFQVDDGLTASDNSADPTLILMEARDMLSQFNIKVHKLASNSEEFMRNIGDSENIDKMCLDSPDSSVCGALGLEWDLTDYNLTFM